MVLLQFQIQVQGKFQEVWGYFSQFENLPEWDTNTKSCKVIKKNPTQIGSVFDVKTVFNGKESTVIYQTKKYQSSKDYGSISFFGKNDKITAFDVISCERKGPNLTKIIYQADICLRHIFCLFTPCIRSGLNDIATQAKEGCLKKCIQKWGRAR